MISDFAEEIIARAIREGVRLDATADGRRIHYQAYERKLAPDLSTLTSVPCSLAPLPFAFRPSPAWCAESR